MTSITINTTARDDQWVFFANSFDGWSIFCPLIRERKGVFTRTFHLPLGTEYRLCIYRADPNSPHPPFRSGEPDWQPPDLKSPTIRTREGITNNIIPNNSTNSLTPSRSGLATFPPSSSPSGLTTSSPAYSGNGPLMSLVNHWGICYLNSAVQVLNACYSKLHTLQPNDQHPLTVRALSQLFQGHLSNEKFMRMMGEICQRDLTAAYDAGSFAGVILEDIKGKDISVLDDFGWDAPSMRSCECQGGQPLRTRNTRVVMTALMHKDGKNLAEDVFWEYDVKLCMHCNKYYKCGKKYVSYPKFLLLKNDRIYGPREFGLEVQVVSQRYKLTGCALHSGGDNYGHYMAVVRFGDEWFLCNDNHVSRFDSEQKAFHKMTDGSRQVLLAFEKVIGPAMHTPSWDTSKVPSPPTLATISPDSPQQDNNTEERLQLEVGPIDMDLGHRSQREERQAQPPNTTPSLSLPSVDNRSMSNGPLQFDNRSALFTTQYGGTNMNPPDLNRNTQDPNRNPPDLAARLKQRFPGLRPLTKKELGKIEGRLRDETGNYRIDIAQDVLRQMGLL